MAECGSVCAANIEALATRDASRLPIEPRLPNVLLTRRALAALDTSIFATADSTPHIQSLSAIAARGRH